VPLYIVTGTFPEARGDALNGAIPENLFDPMNGPGIILKGEIIPKSEIISILPNSP
jgi:hypothetical protein